MPDNIIKVPDTHHPISIESARNHIVVVAGGKVIADTLRALTLHEADLPSVLYIPRRDVNMNALKQSQTWKYCPYKGEAAYFSIMEDAESMADAAWTYGTPHWAVCEIEDHVAFDPAKIERIEVRAL